MQTTIKTIVEFEPVSTTITIASNMLYTSRIINTKLTKLNIELSNNLQEALAKVDRISLLSNDNYLMLAEIQVSAID